MVRAGAAASAGGRSAADGRSPDGSTSPTNTTNEATDRLDEPVVVVQTGLPARMASMAINAGPASRTVVRDVQSRLVIGATV